MNNIARSVLKRAGFTEEYIGIWTSPLYNLSFDENSGGLNILDEEHETIGYVFEDDSPVKFILAAKKFTHVNYRADQPF